MIVAMVTLVATMLVSTVCISISSQLGQLVLMYNYYLNCQVLRHNIGQILTFLSVLYYGLLSVLYITLDQSVCKEDITIKTVMLVAMVVASLWFVIQYVGRIIILVAIFVEEVAWLQLSYSEWSRGCGQVNFVMFGGFHANQQGNHVGCGNSCQAIARVLMVVAARVSMVVAEIKCVVMAVARIIIFAMETDVLALFQCLLSWLLGGLMV